MNNKLIIAILLILGALGFLAYNQGWFSPSPEEVLSMSLKNIANQESVYVNTEMKADFVSEQLESGFSLNFDADIDNSNSEELKTSGSFNASLAMEGTTYSLEGFLISIGDKDFYLKLETIPQIPLMFLNISKLKGEWIKFSNEYAKEDVDQKELERIIEIFKENNPLEFKEELSEEKINGKSAYHYLLSINREKFKSLVIEINKLNNDSMPEEGIQEITNEDVLNEIEDSEIEIWIDKKERLVRRLRIENEFEINPEEGQDEQMGLEIKEGKLNLSFEINMSDFGKEVNIEPPNESKTLEEILSSLEGAYDPYIESTNKAKNSRIKLDLTQIRTLAEMIYDDEYSYSNVCGKNDSLGYNAGTDYSNQLEVIQDDIEEQGSSVNCYANDGSYCISVKLLSSDSEYYCVDSSGTAKETENACFSSEMGCDGQPL